MLLQVKKTKLDHWLYLILYKKQHYEFYFFHIGFQEIGERDQSKVKGCECRFNLLSRIRLNIAV